MWAGRVPGSGTGIVPWSSSASSLRPGPGRCCLGTGTARTCCEVEEHLDVRLPAAMREACLMLGKRADLPAVQDHLLALDRLAWTSRGHDRVPQGESGLRGVGG